MKKLLIRLSILLLIILPILYSLNYMTDKGMRRSRKQNYAVWNDIYNSKINADMIFLGTSRTYMMVSPTIFDSILQLNSHNIGMDGWDLNMVYTRFKIYIQHNKKPKYIIHNIDQYSFKRNHDLYDKEQFIPYLNDPLIRSTTSQYYGKFKLPELYFPFFKYNGHYDLMQEGLSYYFNRVPDTKYPEEKGYFGAVRSWDTTFRDFKKANPNGVYATIDTDLVIQQENFLQYCKDNDIKVIFDFAPVYHEEYEMERNKEQIMAIHRKMAEKYNIPILDYSHDTLCNDTRYFYNSQHLNRMGAEIFSSKMANDVKNILSVSSR